jgi:hypothetical protein
VIVKVGASSEEAALQRDTELVGGGGAPGRNVECVGVQYALEMNINVEGEHRGGMRGLFE